MITGIIAGALIVFGIGCLRWVANGSPGPETWRDREL